MNVSVFWTSCVTLFLERMYNRSTVSESLCIGKKVARNWRERETGFRLCHRRDRSDTMWRPLYLQVYDKSEKRCWLWCHTTGGGKESAREKNRVKPTLAVMNQRLKASPAALFSSMRWNLCLGRCQLSNGVTRIALSWFFQRTTTYWN